jgi:hypothetical protein
MNNALLIELATTWELQAETGGDGLNKLQPPARETLRACADTLRMLVSTDTGEKRVAEMQHLLTSAHAIALRKGEATAWDRFSQSCEAIGIGSITARTYRVLPDDEQPAHLSYPPPTHNPERSMSQLQSLTIGQPLQGGFFAGRINVDGVPYNLVVSPKEGNVKGKWLGDYKEVAGTASYFDGLANTTAMAEAGSPVAKAVQALAIGGFTDWYIPARDELELLYRHFKPTEETNYVFRSGDNPSSLPVGYPYAEDSPLQTAVEGFREGGEHAFEEAWYWASTQYSRYNAWGQSFDGGDQSYYDKAYEGRARAVRRFKAE